MFLNQVVNIHYVCSLSPSSAEEPLEMGETYDVIQRNQPSSKPTQKLLSETDPSYGKLDKVHNCDNLMLFMMVVQYILDTMYF